MLKQPLFLLFFLFTNYSLFSQESIPVLHTNIDVISIRDGDILRKDYWTISSEIELDVYVADKTSKPKVVTFISDIDSISFEIKPREKYNFLILQNKKDSCLTQVKSGITFQPTNVASFETDTLPFTLTDHNNIYIQAIINEKDTVNLMFHTAAGSSVGLTKAATEKTKSLNFNNPATINSWGGQGSGRFSKNNSLQMGNSNWDNLVIWESQNSGPKTDGKFGPNLFENKVIEINYDKSIMVIHPILPKLDDSYTQMNVIFNQHSMFIEGTSKVGGIDCKNTFLIHSGFAGALLFDDNFVSKNKLGKKLKILSESELKDSLGNKLKTRKASLPIFDLGVKSFHDIPIGFFEGGIGNQKQSVLGGDLLKRFNIMLDLQNANIYFQPNSLMNLPYKDV